MFDFRLSSGKTLREAGIHLAATDMIVTPAVLVLHSAFGWFSWLIPAWL